MVRPRREKSSPQLRKHVKAKQDKKGDEEKVEEEIGPRGGSEVSIDPEKGLKIAEIDQHIQGKLGGIRDLTQLMAQRDAMAGEQMYSRFNEASVRYFRYATKEKE